MLPRIRFRDFVGTKIQGIKEYPKPTGGRHLDKASWLTSVVESGGKFGTVISYDGTGITAGIHQAVAVFPRALGRQGPLWSLLQSISDSVYCQELKSLESTLLTESGLILNSGVVTDTKGVPVTGKRLRAALTGSADGIMPESGPQRILAETYAQAFHSVFSSDVTFGIQVSYGQKHFISLSKEKLKSGHSIEDTLMSCMKVSEFYPKTESELELDLALSMLWSHSVNAPAIADSVISPILSSNIPRADIPRILIRRLGNNSFGRWDDDIPGGRYQRTRTAAMSLWPSEFFEGKRALMPKNIEE